MWTAASIVVILVSLGPLIWQMRRLRGDRLTAVAILLIWVRFALSTLGDFAVDVEIAGHSLISLGTLGAVALGALVLPLHLLRNGWAVPFYGFVAFGTFGALLNGAVGPLQEFIVTWSYFLLVALLLHRGFRVLGPRPVLGCMLAAYALPLAAQLLTVALGVPKISEDGSLNYIGGYQHEAVFSLVALGGLWAAAIYPWSRMHTRVTALGLGVLSLLLGNYRTMMIAAAPILLAALALASGARPAGAVKRAGAVVAVAVILLPLLTPQAFSERFSDIDVFLQNAESLAQRPEEFTAAEKNIFSARVYLWSKYFFSVADADLPQFLMGHGPGALADKTALHPHNDYLYMTFQFGVIGALLWYGILAAQFVIAARAYPRSAGMMTAAGHLGLLIAAMGTSPFTRPEGVIVLATLCATTWYLRDRPRADA